MTGAPIFILGFQRGGTNQLLNVLRSHPDTAWPDGELHEVLRPTRPAGRVSLRTARTMAGYLPLALRHGDFLNPHRPPPARDPGPAARAWIADRLAAAVRANAAETDRYHRAMRQAGFHAAEPPVRPRMLVKLVNYNVGLAGVLHRIYPDARFVGITRDLRGICESMMARGMSVDRITALYTWVAGRLGDLPDQGVPLTVMRFEDLIADLPGQARQVYAACGLDPDATTGLCLQRKQRVTDTAGRVTGIRKDDLLYPMAEAARHVRADVNDRAAASLPEAVRLRIVEECSPILHRLGYPVEAPPADLTGTPPAAAG